LRAVKPSGEPVRRPHAGDEFQVAAWVVGRIAALPGRRRAAVLFRMNAQSRLIEEALMRHGMPYLVVGGVGFYERKEIKDIVSYLRLVRNPQDPMALRRVLNVPPRGIGARTLDEIEAAAAQRGISLWDALAAVEEEALLPARATQPLRRFRELVESLRAEAAGMGVKDLISRVLAASGYAAALSSEDTHESQDRLENLAEHQSAAAEYEARSEDPNLTGFLDQVSLLADTDMVRDDAPVVLMTLHSAKGLEYDAVFLVGLEEGLMPHVRSLENEDAIEEERRLVYVGMTRARERLHLSWAQSRHVYGQRRTSLPSRFLEEIPRDRLEVSGESARAQTPWGRSAPGRPGATWGEARPMRFGAAERPAAAAPLPVTSPVRAGIRPGTKVRHPMFGVGTVIRSEGSGDDLKLTVSFLGIGAKRLVARYAGQEVV
jgi:DNA helicase-2/ATP-dependent DNA helicase PcrA